MKFNQRQIDILSKYFSDLSKILIASTVIGFFVPVGVGPITMPVFLIGSATALFCLILSIKLVKKTQYE